MPLIVCIQVVLQLVHQAGEFSDGRGSERRDAALPDVRLNDGSPRSLLDEFDEELHALVRLIGNSADLLFLVRRQRIFGLLCVRAGDERKKQPQENGESAFPRGVHGAAC